MLAQESGNALRVLKAFSQHNQIWQMALAISLGVVAGLIPKLNLLAVVIYAIIVVCPVHTVLAISVSLLVSLCANQLDPLTHRLGMWLLAHPKAEGLWLRLDVVPLVPWFNLHNSVVLGSFVAGLILFYPVFLIAYSVLKWIDTGDERKLAAQRRRFELLAPMSALPAPLVSSRNPGTQAQARILPVSRWHVGNPVLSRAVVTPITSVALQDTRIDNSTQAEAYSDTIPTVQIESSNLPIACDAARIVLTAENIDPIGAAPSTDCTPNHAGIDGEVALEREDSDEQWLIETTIEVVRLAEEAVAKKRNEPEPTDLHSARNMTHNPRVLSASTCSPVSPAMQISPATEIRLLELAAPQEITVDTSNSQSVIADSVESRISSASLYDATRSSWNTSCSSSLKTNCDLRNSLAENREGSDNREEALRYLLRHLREIKERV